MSFLCHLENIRGISDVGCRISVIIPNLNGIDFLPGCLSALEKQTFKDCEIIIVDNGSKDDSVNFIRKNYPWVKNIELSQNIGFAAACNLGIQMAKGRHVAILNNDTEVVPQWLESLSCAAERDERIGMVASKILLSLETREIDSVGMLLYPDGIGRQRGRGEIDRGQFDQEEEIFYPSACAALYRMEMLKEIGFFDEDFFAYCEDTDIGLRGRLAGWKAILAPKAVVYHKYSVTGGKYSPFKAEHIERNRIWVVIKNLPLTWILRMPYYTLLRYTIQLYGMLTSKGSTSKLRESQSIKDILFMGIRAYISSLKGLPLMLRKRKTIERKIKNKEFISMLKRYKISAAELILKD